MSRSASKFGTRLRRAELLTRNFELGTRNENLAHGEDADDANLPLMYWYAAEPVVAADVAWAAEALAACKIPKVSEFIARRMAESSSEPQVGTEAAAVILPLSR